MKFLSVCSGIEAVSVATQHLGWRPLGFSEIEPFPSAVLAHHYPDVPNLGDMTKHKEWILDDRLDLLVGGCPCQAFSVAGARRSLDDERGNLTLTFCNIADQFNPKFVWYENVPGILNTKDNAFGCLLSALAGFDEVLKSADGKWRGSGMVVGRRRRVAWVTLDAQFFGVPQRRRRVFVLAVDAQSVADSPKLCPSKILSIGTSLRRDTPTRRKAGEEVADSVGRVTKACNDITGPLCADGGTAKKHGCGGLTSIQHMLSGFTQPEICFGIDEECNASDNHFGPLLRGGQGGTRQAVAFQQNTRDEVRLMGGDGSYAGALAAQAGMKQTNYICEPVKTQVDVQMVCFANAGHFGGLSEVSVADSLRATGGDTGNGGESLVTIMAHGQANAEIRSDGVSPSLTCNHETPIVVHGTQDPCGSDIAFAQGRNNGGENVVAFQQNVSEDIFTNPIAGTVGTNPNASGRNTQMVQSKMSVRRLVPEECEILMGFPVGYTDIKLKGKPTPDGPRYKALGNSMAVPVMRYIASKMQEALERSTK